MIVMNRKLLLIVPRNRQLVLILASPNWSLQKAAAHLNFEHLALPKRSPLTIATNRQLPLIAPRNRQLVLILASPNWSLRKVAAHLNFEHPVCPKLPLRKVAVAEPEEPHSNFEHPV
jgi:hypothetical protein